MVFTNLVCFMPLPRGDGGLCSNIPSAMVGPGT